MLQFSVHTDFASFSLNTFVCQIFCIPIPSGINHSHVFVLSGPREPHNLSSHSRGEAYPDEVSGQSRRIVRFRRPCTPLVMILPSEAARDLCNWIQTFPARSPTITVSAFAAVPRSGGTATCIQEYESEGMTVFAAEYSIRSAQEAGSIGRFERFCSELMRNRG